MLRITGAGAEQEGDVSVDEYMALMIEWPPQPDSTFWWIFHIPQNTMLEVGFNEATGELNDLTLVTPGPIAVVEHGPPLAAPHVIHGVPRVDPSEWHRRAPTGSVEEFVEHYIRDREPVRTELGPTHLLVRIGEGDEDSASEMVCGRLRAGLSAEQALVWLCVDGFSPAERDLLTEHAERSHAPPTWSTPAPPPRRGLSRYIDQLLKRG